MSVVSGHMAQCIAQGSMIRRMFDAGIELRKKYGARGRVRLQSGQSGFGAAARSGEGHARVGRSAA